jgi:hypothetical protein
LNQLILEIDRDYCKHSNLTTTSSTIILSILQKNEWFDDNLVNIIKTLKKELWTYNYTIKNWHTLATGINPDDVNNIYINENIH